MLQLTDISMQLGTKIVLDHVELRVGDTERVAIVGRNGAGKSTLMKIAAGVLHPDGGKVSTSKGEDVGYLAQEHAVSGPQTLWSEAQKAVEPVLDLERKANALLKSLESGDVPEDEYARVAAVAEGIRLAASLFDMPPDVLHTDAFVDTAREVAQQVGASIEVIAGDELVEKGYGGLWGVGKAATHKPALAVLTWDPPGATETLAWVGKGIVYDTGGLSIKTKTGMPGMKGDMGGAGAVLGAFQAAATRQAKQRIHALLCLAENSVGPDSTRPDDILDMYSGKTVEVNNTDAEGRLVLADGVAHATKHLSPDVVVDMATLTGAQLMATGKRHAALVCNDDELEARAVAAGKVSGDLTHPLPYVPEFFRKEFKSEIADLKNSVKDRMNAQSSCAGQFVAEHLVEHDGAWLHIDLAGPAGYDNGRGTGYGVALLAELFGF